MSLHCPWHYLQAAELEDLFAVAVNARQVPQRLAARLLNVGIARMMFHGSENQANDTIVPHHIAGVVQDQVRQDSAAPPLHFHVLDVLPHCRVHQFDTAKCYDFPTIVNVVRQVGERSTASLLHVHVSGILIHGLEHDLDPAKISNDLPFTVTECHVADHHATPTLHLGISLMVSHGAVHQLDSAQVRYHLAASVSPGKVAQNANS
mmetsp:Transcript_46148/g.122318  ORF Transcript_46148/g.122318 Transcript_46148/m.122318 type:complete len:206 (-) Transcript_46148:571-1188(-)